MIKFSDFSFSYHGTTHPTLSHINLEINEGDWIVITGHSGCGKSTMALALAGFLFQQDYGNYLGDITYYNQSIPSIPLYDMADKINLVQQNPENQFCTLTVLDELAFGLENRLLPIDEIRARIEWALGVVNGHNLLDKDIASLSGGEKQKIAIASMLAAKPSVLILDEPTSNLDRISTESLFNIFDVLRKQNEMTIIIIEHKLEQLLPFKPKIYWMVEGSVQEMNFSIANTMPDSIPGNSKIEENLPTSIELFIDVKDLSSGYAQSTVLKNVSFSLSSGEFISLIGLNGSGKSTLLLSLMGLLALSKNSVIFCNQDISTMKVQEIGKNMGIVFQNPDHQLFTESVLSEATFAPNNFHLPPSLYEENLFNLLNSCGLRHLSETHPQKLSYGEKRRLNLISVLCYAPKVLLLDEILIGQDRKNGQFLMELLKNYTNAGGSIILAHHQPEIVNAYTTRTILLNDGRIILDCQQDQANFELSRIDQHFLPLNKDALLPC